MSDQSSAQQAQPGQDRASLLEEVELRHSFGPIFFLRQLRSFVRDRCPDPAEGLPAVQLHLADGEALDVCHIIGVAPGWLALAVNDTDRASEPPTMRTELVPYDMISRVTICGSRRAGPHIGFEQGHEPNVVPRPAARRTLSPEEALRAAAAPGPRAGRRGGGLARRRGQGLRPV